ALVQSEVEAREVMSVPSVFLNGEPFDSGRLTIEQILARLDTGSAAREAEKIKGKDAFDMLVIGGGPAGAAAAIFGSRKGMRPRLVPASDPGGLIEVQLANGATLRSRSMVLSTGARWRQMGVPGEEQYRNK